MNRYMIVLVFLFLISSVSVYHPIVFDSMSALPEINQSCILRGESLPPPPFVVLRWNSSGFCDSTIDHFTHFYDIKGILKNNTDYILFLESK